MNSCLPESALPKTGDSPRLRDTPSATTLERLRPFPANSCNGAPCHWLTEENLRAFIRLYEQRNLYAVFQPILEFRGQRYFGYEGLIRGPADSALHSPAILFGLAHECGLTVEFERLCREIVLQDFARLKLEGRLFINASIASLADPRFSDGETRQLLQELHLRPGQIVIEVTENQQVGDFGALREVLDHYRNQGYQIAIDDLGEGFSNLRMWSEINPDFVKVDQHFIRGIADDPLKFRLVQAMRDIAESCGAGLIAEGIETGSEFATVRDLGIAHGQGFLIARPMADPESRPSTSVRQLLNQCNLIVFPRQHSQSGATVRQLVQTVAPLAPHMLNDEAYDRFAAQPEQIALPVVSHEGSPLGLINRYSLIDRFARPFRRELYGRRPCTQFMNATPIRVDHSTPVQELGQMLGFAEPHQLIDGFIVTENDRYLGIGTAQTLMGLITDMQIRAARYANPLTQLPGNVPINEHIDRLLANEVAFIACYCDLDHFKPYNDCYGYREGDRIIQLVATLLTRHCEPRQDFIGHVGGDDFILLMQSHDWEERCRAILTAFDASIVAHANPEHLAQGGYFAENRRGTRVFHPLPALSIGALAVETYLFHSHHEVSSALGSTKKQAKKIPGSALFIERRRHGALTA